MHKGMMQGPIHHFLDATEFLPPKVAKNLRIDMEIIPLVSGPLLLDVSRFVASLHNDPDANTRLLRTVGTLHHSFLNNQDTSNRQMFTKKCNLTFSGQ